MSITIKDIAKLANVSITTVSKIINSKDHDISEDTRKRVNEIIQQHNYRPSALASGLVTRKTNTIGLLVPDISNAFFSEVARGAEDIANREGFNVILCNTDDNQAKELEYINILKVKRVDGVIFVSAAHSDHSTIKELTKSKIPVVAVDRPLNDESVKVVHLDNVTGGYIATKHLIEQGHARIGCITGPLGNKSAKDRFDGYVKAMFEFGMHWNEDDIFEGDYRVAGGVKGARQLISKGVTAIFTCNDMMACGVYKVAHEQGIDIPGDISIVGFDDIFISEILTPPLTTVKQPSYEMGSASAEILIGMINGSESTEGEKQFMSSLNIRQSVRPPGWKG